MPQASILLIPLLPLIGFLVPALGGKTIFKKQTGWFATFLLAVSTALACSTAWNYFFSYGKENGIYQKHFPFHTTWLQLTDTLSIDMGILLDPISALMIVVVCIVSLMVHLYSLGYMKHEERYAMYFAYLGLFTFSMLGLVLSSNLFQIYMFWELVGVSSYLLIGFYFERPKAVAAAKKAFIVTRFADLGFLIGILALSYQAESLDFVTLLERLTQPNSTYLTQATTSSFLGISSITWGCLLLFMGGAGKSALFPLHIWLPDAMEGPTPVSALIHAATMVVAGVFLIARMFPLYALGAPEVLDIVAYTGAFTALFAALIACTQTDIKRVLAYSTMSQIGFMIFALGVSGYGGTAGLGYSASLFHLFTHALFKAMLFLGAGSIIHFVHSNELKDMGGLRKSLPVTHLTFLIGCLALSGIPPFSGFFSKEGILLAAYQQKPFFYGIGLFTSLLTAFYMFRLYFSVFWNKPQQNTDRIAGDGGLTTTLPLLILAAGTCVSGFIPFGQLVSSDGIPFSSSLHLGFAVLPVLLAIAGISLAFLFYQKDNLRAAYWSEKLKGFYKTTYHKFYIDECYMYVTQKIFFNLIGKSAAWIDRNIVDGLLSKTGSGTQVLAEKIKSFQSGKLQSYTTWYLIGIIVLIGLFTFFIH